MPAQRGTCDLFSFLNCLSIADRVGPQIEDLIAPARVEAIFNREGDRALKVEQQTRVQARSSEFNCVVEMEVTLRALQSDLDDLG
jgi:hypothetical protein